MARPSAKPAAIAPGVSERSKTGEPAAEWVALDALVPWDKNPRKNDRNVARVVASIKRFGFAAPIIARRADGEIIAGHTRYAAAQALGLDRVPVRYVDLDPADAHLLALADNRLTERGEWDEPQLLALLGDLRQQGTDAALVAGWDDAEIDALIKRAGNDILDATVASGSPDDVEFKEYDESIADDVKTVTCPHCGGNVPV